MSTVFRVLHVVGFSLWFGALVAEYLLARAYGEAEVPVRLAYAGIHRHIDRIVIHAGLALVLLAGVGMLFTIGFGTVFGTRGGLFHLKILLGLVAVVLQGVANASFRRALEALSRGSESEWMGAFRRWRLLAGIVLLMLLYNLLAGVITTS